MGNAFRSEEQWQAFLADQAERLHAALAYISSPMACFAMPRRREDVCQQAVVKAACALKSDELSACRRLLAGVACTGGDERMHPRSAGGGEVEKQGA